MVALSTFGFWVHPHLIVLGSMVYFCNMYYFE